MWAGGHKVQGVSWEVEGVWGIKCGVGAVGTGWEVGVRSYGV